MPARLVALVLAGSILLAQKEPAVAGADPWTRGDPALMAAVGIEAWAPMPLAGEHSTKDVDVELGDDPPVRWAETRHFKIGVALRDRPWPTDKTERKELRKELLALGSVLPDFKLPNKKITSWHLVLLYAQRLEELYGDFRGRVGFTAEEPAPTGHGHDGRGFHARGSWGKGPWLGQHGKFVVLVLERRSDLARYLRRFAGREAEEGTCHHFVESNSLVFVTTPDVRTGALATERALYCNVIYGVIRNLVTGYRGYTYEVPVWNVEGLAHWYRRRFDTKYNSMAALPEGQWGLLHDADWEAKSRARVETGAFAKASDLLRWRQQDLDTFHHHVMMWARVDFLMAQGDEKFARYLEILKALPSFGVDWDQAVAQQTKALHEAYGLDEGAFDTAWTEWVEANYKLKRR
ncbi:MAG: hypothetical protein AB7O97_21875 [Planctomycetota bacterium]